METLSAILKVTHIITAVLMGWPFYALVAVNQRARLGPPLGDRVDLYLESVIKNRTVPCFVFQGTALLTGLWLAYEHGLGVGDFTGNPRLVAKLALLLLIGGLLLYVHTTVQPAIDLLFTEFAGAPIPPEAARRIATLRRRRKRIATVCLFTVLTLAMLGVQVWTPFPSWLTAALLAVITLFTWRAYRSVTPFGWA